MAKLPAVFNATKHDGRMGFNVIPKARYKLRIVKSEMKQTKDKKGSYALLNIKVVEGQHKGNIIFVRLNLVNQNDEAVRIAQNELATICDACKKSTVKDTEELHGIDFYGDVDIKPADDNYPEGNIIRNYYTLEKGKAGMPKSKVKQQAQDDDQDDETDEEGEVDEADDETGEESEQEEEQEAPEPETKPSKKIFARRK